MKKFLIVLTFLFANILCIAQISGVEKQAALDLIKQHQIKLGLTNNDLENTDISSTYLNNASGVRMIYLTQTFKTIPVFNKMLVLAFKNNELVSLTGSRVSNIDEIVNLKSGIPAIRASTAVQSVLTELKLATKVTITSTIQENGKLNFGNLDVSEVDVIAELVWLPISEKNVVLTWQIEIAPLKTVDHLLIRVDAASGKVLDKNNYTVYEKLNDLKKTNKKHDHSSADFFSTNQLEPQQSPLVVSSASYRVIPFPAESPLHANGAAALVTDPWNLAGGNATSLQWHFDGTTYHDSTRGNNVWAQEDRDNNNINGKAATSSSAQPTLTFDIAPDYTSVPTTTNFQRFATTNLFYWNNLLHDLTYNYGFNEASGNFQNNNQGRGGSANDYVVADAQDGSGTNNANFSTPVDGSRPRMQMYLSSYTTPNRDGDLDNGVIAHEYMHGVSNRLTGGPANSSCLSNAEQGGEGWSDYLALMSVTNWATATTNDGAIARPIGTYLFGQAPTGAGIRTYPYSTNMSINPNTYTMMATSSGVHRIGEIWCSALWDMTWEMIAMDGINTNIFNNSGIGGNSAALKLVIEGMRLQPCSPGYIDARNAILKADTIYFGSKYSCAIWKAFARRGMGKFASQGSSSSTTDQTADFTVNSGLSFSMSQSVTQQAEGSNVTYTHTINTGNCGAIVNHIIRDTLPNNVTYVSGGTYDTATRVVSFPVSLAFGETQNYAFTVTIKNGAYFTPVLLLDETVPTTTISNVWTPTSSTSTNWITSTAQKTSAPNSFFTSNLITASDQKLETTSTLLLPVNPPSLTFQGYINSESGWDGGIVEISTNNGTTWTDLGALMVSGGYNGVLGASTNPLSGKSAFNGNSGGFVKTTINLSAYANQIVKFRFRFGSDESVAGLGWYIDDIQLKSTPQVNIKGILFNASNAKVAISDTVTVILPGANTCIPATISSQPANVSICENITSATVSVTASGTGISYQWQSSADNGVSFLDVANENNATYNLSNLTTSNIGNQYRCKINGTCTIEFFSASSTLSINSLPNSPVTTGVSRCGTGTLVLSSSAGTNETIEWFAASTGGAAIRTGLTFTTPSINTSTNYYAQAKNAVTGCVSASRTITAATILSTPTAPTGIGASTCASTSAILSASTSNGQTINWYSAAVGGTLLATSSNTYSTPNLTATTIYYAEAKNGICVSSTRTAVTATVNALPAIVATFVNASKCGTDTSTISATALTGMTINWYADSLATNLLQSGTVTGLNKFITPSLSSTTLYWAVQRNLTTGCKSSISRRVTTTRNPRPANPTVTNRSRCGSGRVTLTAVAPTNPVGTLAWYSTTTSITSLSTASSYQTPTISVSTTYYVEARTTSTGCLSLLRSPVVASINAIPAAPVAVGASRCRTGTVTIGATPASGLTANWYSASTNGTLLLSNSLTYITPSITATRTYYAQAGNATTTCTSTTRTAVIATVSTTTPARPTTLSGLVAICPIVGTANGTTYSASSVTGISSYKWSIPTGAVIDSGNAGLKIRVRFLTAGTNDSVNVQSNNGCLSVKRGLKLTTAGCATTPLAKGNSITSSATNFSVDVFPNPSQNKFSVKLNTNSAEIFKVSILDIQGRILKTISSNPANIINFGNDLKSGLYIIKLQQGKNTYSQKIFKL